MDIFINDRQDFLEVSSDIREAIDMAVEACLLEEKKDRDYEISISFVENDEIRKLNRKFRNIDRDTDVLSFPVDSSFSGGEVKILGDIIISTEKAIEQSIDYGHSILREIVYLVVHSMYHLMGYDHLNDRDRIIMREKEKNIMKKIEIFK